MSTTYTDVFTGKNITAAFPQYGAIALTGNITLSWPAQFQNTNSVVCVIMDITPDAGGRTVTMPDARDGSVGFAFTVNNPSAHSFDLLTNTGTTIVTVAANQANLVWLIGKSTAAGTWRNIPAFGGGGAVTSVDATSDSTNLVITGNPGLPITTGGTIQFSVRNDLLALTAFGASTGFAVRTAANTWALRALAATANQINVTNPSGIAGNPTISLAPNITGVTSLTLAGISLGVGAANVIASTGANTPIVLTPNGTGEITLSSDTRLDTGKKLKFTASGSANYITFRAGATSVNQDLIWPTTAGGVGQVMTTDGSGSLSWSTIITLPGTSTLNAVARYSNTTGSLKDSPNFLVTDAGAATGLISCEIGDIKIATIDSQTITSRTADQDVIVAPNGNGSLRIQGDIRVQSSNGFQRKLRLYNSGGGAYAGLQSTTAMVLSVVWTMPPASAAGIFTTDLTNQISISPYSTFFPAASTLNAVPRYSNTTGYPLADSLFVIDNAGVGSGLTGLSVTGDTQLLPSGGAATKLRLYNNANTFYAGLKCFATMAANVTWTLPSADGNAYLRSDGAGNLSLTALTTTANNISKYSDTVGTLAVSGGYIDSNNNFSLGTTSIGTSGTNSITLTTGTSVTAAGASLLSIATRNTGSGNVIALYGAGDGGVSASTTNTITNKISVYVNGTRYYLLASTSSA